MAKVDVDAARLAILSVYGAVGDDRAVDTARLILDSGSRVVSWENAAVELSQLPKPVQCGAEVENSSIRVTCRSVSSDYLAVYQYQLDDLGQQEGPIGSLVREPAESCQAELAR